MVELLTLRKSVVDLPLYFKKVAQVVLVHVVVAGRGGGEELGLGRMEVEGDGEETFRWH